MSESKSRSIDEESVISESKMYAMASGGRGASLIRKLLAIIERRSREHLPEYKMAVDFGDRVVR